jgi:hypothetical protein
MARFAFELLSWTAEFLQRRGDMTGAKETRRLATRAEKLYLDYMR